MEIVPLLLQSLQLCFASPKFKIQCLITLSACIEGCDSSCKQFLTNEGMPTVVKVLAENQNCKELQKSALCVLQTYLEQTKITIPECMDDVLKKIQIAPDNLLQVENGKQNIEGEGEVDVTNVEDGSSNGSESNVENRDIMPSGQTDMIVNRIQDLTNEVRSLKELCAFTVEQKSVSDNRIDRLMAMMNTTTRSGVIFSNKDVDSNKVDTSVSETGVTCDEMKEKLDSTDSNSIEDNPCNQIVGEDMQGEKIQNGDDVVGMSEQIEASKTSESPFPHPIGNSIKAGPVTDSNEQIPIHSNTFDCTIDHNQDYPKVEDLKTNPDPNSEIIPSQKGLDVDTIRSSSDVCSETCNGDSNCDKVANIRCGKTPKNQKTEMINSRASKRPFITTANEKRNNGKSSKRRLRLSESDHEDSPFTGQEILSESPVDKSVDFDIPVHDMILKAPFPPKKKRKEPLLFEHNKKGICRKCLGCRVDFAKVNSRNYLGSIRRSINTCTEHRLFVMEVVSALQRYKKFKETKKRSPDFDFVSSPKVNVRCEGFPREIAKSVKPHDQKNSSRPTKKPFTAREIEILKEGVDKYGPRFSIIERYCEFSTRRSAKTLKQKYTSLMQATCYKPKKRCPFTVQEEENLKEGVSKYGFQWKKILNHYSFMPQKTPQNLKDKWRNMLK
ncbi:uncharacterized protein LOC114539354 [Dendronephthya gigantea]|uniref:uncharacterized protein LOC114539354 n=1 Tax=Dendronephthya gigantea TaxID=151771 RepID=UPI0010698107|nr:uncharacterized protein LOC114539354 [Dendronephthya gigantea]